MTGQLGQGQLRQIFLDCDGVLADMDEKILSLFGYSNAAVVLGKSEFWKTIANHRGFYQHLKPMPGAFSFVKEVKAICDRWGLYKPAILTGIPQGEWAEPQKRAWRQNNFPDLEMICCASRNKRYYMKSQGDILIEDRTNYQDLWEKHGGIFIKHTDPERSLYLLECTLEDHGARV